MIHRAPLLTPGQIQELKRLARDYGFSFFKACRFLRMDPKNVKLAIMRDRYSLMDEMAELYPAAFEGLHDGDEDGEDHGMRKIDYDEIGHLSVKNLAATKVWRPSMGGHRGA